MTFTFARRLLAATALVSLVGCGDDSTTPSGGTGAGGNSVATETVEPTLSDIQAKILTPTCATSKCHDGSTDDPKLILTAGNTYKNAVNAGSEEVAGAKIVVPGDPDNSLLFTTLTKSNGPVGKMPKGLAPLSAAQQAAIKQWIADGAKDN
jgi:hypothetical protein